MNTAIHLLSKSKSSTGLYKEHPNIPSNFLKQNGKVGVLLTLFSEKGLDEFY
jgi:hypothetical protein